MILIALGSNLSSQAGSPADTLRAALAELAQGDMRVAKVSALYKTAAWPDPSDPSYVNAVAAIETALSPQAVMERLHAIERHFGRARGTRNAPRTLDLDLIDYNGRIEAGRPVLPHPRLAARGFVLVPLRDVAPQWKHPVSGLSVDAMIAALPEGERAPERLG